MSTTEGSATLRTGFSITEVGKIHLVLDGQPFTLGGLAARDPGRCNENARKQAIGIEPNPGAPEDMALRLKTDYEKVGELAKAIGMRQR